MERQEIIQELGKDLITFGKVISPKSFYLPSPQFHYELAQILMNRENIQVCIQAPRGFAKSTLAVLFILHHIVYDPGDKVIVIQSKTQPEAVNRLWKIKNILNYSKNFIQIYGYAGEEIARQWNDKKIKTSIMGYDISIKAIGTGMPARGTLESGIEQLPDGSWDIGDDTRITLYYNDDPDDEDNTKTSEAMNYNYSKFAGNKEGLDLRTGRVIVVGTPIRAGCIVDKLYDSTGWISKKYMAVDENGNLLWEELRDKKWLQDKKQEYKDAGLISKYYSEFECKIVGEEDQLFKPDDFRYYDGELLIIDGDTFLKITSLHKIKLKEPIIKPINIFQGYDPASSTKQTADYSVRFTVGFDEEKNIYCLPYYHRRVTPLEFADEMLRAIEFENPKRGHVESVGYQEMLRQYVREKLRENNLSCPGLEIKFNPRTEKSARLETLQPYFAQHKVFLQENMKEFEDELMMYPRGKHDDLIDGFYYATRKLFTPHHIYRTKEQIEKDELEYFLTRINGSQKTAWMRN